MGMTEREDTIERLKRDLELIRKKREEIIREDTIERLERVLKMTKKSITVTIPKLTAERAVSMLKEPKAVEPVLDADTWACGNCNHPVEHDYLVAPNVWFHELHNFCPFCGKKLDWVDKEIK